MSADAVNQKLKSTLTGTPKPMARSRAKRSEAIGRFFNSRLRLSQIRMLVAIADLGQLKRVADTLNVTPPAISKQLSELEQALGGIRPAKSS